MGQGSINQFQGNRTTPIEGIANALKAVNEYYGIDTTKAQAKVAQAQAEAAQRDNIAAQSAAEGKPNDYWRITHGEKIVKKVSLPEGFAAPSSGTIPASNNIPTSKLLASNGSGVSELASLISQVKDPSAIKNATGVSYSPDGKTANIWGLDDKHSKEQVELTNAELETGLKKQALAKGNTEAQTAEKTKYKPFVDEFNKISQPLLDQQAALKDVQQALTSGNGIQERIGSLKDAMAQLGLKRITTSTGEVVSPESLVAKSRDEMNQSVAGHLSPTTIHELLEGTNLALKSNYEHLNNAALNHASQAANYFGGKPEQIAQKFMLSGIKPPEQVETRLVKSGGTTVLQKLDSGAKNMSDNKNWITIDTGQNTPSLVGKGKMGNFERAAIYSASKMKSVFADLVGKVGHVGSTVE